MQHRETFPSETDGGIFIIKISELNLELPSVFSVSSAPNRQDHSVEDVA